MKSKNYAGSERSDRTSFIFLDHAGPVSIAPGRLSSMDVLPHPHIGLSTVTYLLNGQVTHRDSLGVEQIYFLKMPGNYKMYNS